MHFPTVSKQTTFQTIGRHHCKRILTDREARALNQHQQYARNEEHGSESQVRVVHTKQRKNVDCCTYNERGFGIMAIKNQSVKAMSKSNVERQGERVNEIRNWQTARGIDIRSEQMRRNSENQIRTNGGGTQSRIQLKRDNLSEER